MPLSPGRSLGPYEILAPLGAGGMGEVYEAKDTRLGRTVAIKVLPEGLAENPERRARFEREARTVSQLTHPHVCTLHDVGEEEGLHFLVMEHLEGETLAERLASGAMPLEETLRYGAQIAEALEAAHRQGVIHRDLKPANVMLTSSGVKLLDFGLARLAAGEAGEVNDLPTMTMREDGDLTEEGTILGTYPYMSPEQVEGNEADSRSDLFALGAVLYEMVTGERAFSGESAASVMAAVLREEPEPITKIEPVSPPSLDHVVSRCLAKDPERRWQSARDIAEELHWIRESGSRLGVAAPVAKRRKMRERLVWGIASVATILALVGLGWSLLQRSIIEEATRPFWAELTLGEGATVAGFRGIAVSPEGARIALLVDSDEGDRRLVVRNLTSGLTKALQGTENASYPFWSPDGRWIGFFAYGQLKRIPATGGPVQALADAPHGRGATWSSDGSIIYSPDIEDPLVRIPDSGGEPSQLTDVASKASGHRAPHVLPGGRHVLYLANEVFGSGRIVVSSVESPDETRLLVENGSGPQYANGFLFWVRKGNLLAQPFDADSLELSGSPVAIAENVDSGKSIGGFSVSEDVLAWREAREEVRRLVRLDMEGRQIETFGDPGPLWTFDFSRAGGEVLLGRGPQGGAGGWDLWVMSLDRRQETRVTFSNALGLSGAFSPDAEEIAVSIWKGEEARGGKVWTQPASGTGVQKPLLDTSDIHYVREWSPDSGTLVSRVQRPGTSMDIFYLSVDEPETLLPFAATRYEEAAPRLSPDGKWIAYASDESGQWEVYVSDFPGRRTRRQISRGGLVSPGGAPILEWSPEGSAIYYGAETGLVKVPVAREGGGIEFEESETLGIDTSRLGPSRFLVDGATILAPAVVEDRGVKIRIVRHWKGLLEY